jgi:hypothetical protein
LVLNAGVVILFAREALMRARTSPETGRSVPVVWVPWMVDVRAVSVAQRERGRNFYDECSLKGIADSGVGLRRLLCGGRRF